MSEYYRVKPDAIIPATAHAVQPFDAKRALPAAVASAVTIAAVWGGRKIAGGIARRVARGLLTQTTAANPEQAIVPTETAPQPASENQPDSAGRPRLIYRRTTIVEVWRDDS